MELNGFYDIDTLTVFLEDGKITHLQFVMHNLELKPLYEKFCTDNDYTLQEESAKFFFEKLASDGTELI